LPNVTTIGFIEPCLSFFLSGSAPLVVRTSAEKNSQETQTNVQVNDKPVEHFCFAKRGDHGDARLSSSAAMCRKILRTADRRHQRQHELPL
jgi:hypothetical protein